MRREKKAKAEGAVIITLVAMMVLILTVSVLASELEPTGPPSEGAMKTLDEIYSKLETIESNCVPAPPTSCEGATVPKTGQTICSDSDGIEITCAGTGQDGEYQKGVEWPTPRFIDNGDGTVTDNMTDLIWLKNADCFGLRTWTNALSDCNGLASGTCGLTDGSSAGDWRLPNVNELISLIDRSQFNPALPSGHFFTGVQFTTYWSSTSHAADGSYLAWTVSMVHGVVFYYVKTTITHVWPVRGGID